MSLPPTPKRRAEDGQAVIFALVVLLLVSIACAVVAADLNLKLRAMREESERAGARWVLDAAIADALAELVVDDGFRGHRQQVGRGEFATTVEMGPDPCCVIVLAQARYLRQNAAAQAVVALTGGVRVVRWQRLPAGRGGEDVGKGGSGHGGW